MSVQWSMQMYNTGNRTGQEGECSSYEYFYNNIDYV